MEAEKLTIDQEKIIRILLKQLMYLKNENAYIKNNASLQLSDSGIQKNNIGDNSSFSSVVKNNIGAKSSFSGAVKNNIGGNSSFSGAVKNNIGAKSSFSGAVKNNIGDNSSFSGVVKNNIGGNSSFSGVVKNNIGAKSSFSGAVKNNIGDKSSFSGVVKNNIGDNSSFSGVVKNNIGDKLLFMALPNLNDGAKREIKLYTVFEEGLIAALEQYIKNGDGRNSLYPFYADFEEAVNEKNRAAENLKEAAKSMNYPEAELSGYRLNEFLIPMQSIGVLNQYFKIKLEDTHILPKEIIIDNNSFRKVGVALHRHLPRNAPWEMYDSVAFELLNLHNAKKLTGAQLRNFTALSVTGFAKHLLKLKQYNLVKSEPPRNYVLTENSKYILLKLFGVPKI